MGDITVTVKGAEETRRVLERYAELNTKKTFPEISKAKTIDMAFKSLQETDAADRNAIENLKYRSWWPKYVASRLAGAGVKMSRKATRTERFLSGNKRISFKRQGKFTRSQAREASKKIIAGRLKGRSFIKAGWLFAIRDLQAGLPSADRVSTKGEASPRGAKKGYGKSSATGSRIASIAGNTALNAKHTRTPAGALAVASKGAEKGVQKSKADMLVYIERKMREAANRAGVPVKDSLTGRFFIPSI